MREPKYRIGQLVGLLDHNPKRPSLPYDHPEYRIDTGRIVKVTRVWYYPRTDGIQFEYDVRPGPDSIIAHLHEVWLRPLTGQEITGRVSEPELLR